MTDIPTLGEAEAVAEKFLEHFKEFEQLPQRFADSINKGLELIPSEWVVNKVKELWEHLKSLLAELVNLFKEVARFVIFPSRMIVEWFRWRDIKGDISNAAGRVDPANYTPLLATQEHNWKSDGATEYTRCAASQAGSLNQVKDIADGIANAVGLAGVSGVTLYASLAALIAETVTELYAEAGAAETGVGVLAAIGGAVITALKNGAIARILITGAITFAGTQVQSCLALESKLTDESKFPDRHWPDPGSHVWGT